MLSKDPLYEALADLSLFSASQQLKYKKKNLIWHVVSICNTQTFIFCFIFLYSYF